MFKCFRTVFAVAVLTVGTYAAAAEMAGGHPDTYVVKRGDTLWDISARFLKKPWLWPEIWQANPQVKNPHLIYPGDVLSLVYIDGQPQVRAVRPDVQQDGAGWQWDAAKVLQATGGTPDADSGTPYVGPDDTAEPGALLARIDHAGTAQATFTEALDETAAAGPEPTTTTSKSWDMTAPS